MPLISYLSSLWENVSVHDIIREEEKLGDIIKGFVIGCVSYQFIASHLQMPPSVYALW